MESKKVRTMRKWLSDRGATYNVHVEGMVFPFATEESRENYVQEILADHPDMKYTYSYSKLDQDLVAEVGE